ncbi:MAG TPA: AMP-binding protein [Methylomirabilota bacterium]|nr:AMP-binding protein [Methylomirabilota bacterium]
MNIARQVERAANGFPDHPAIVFEGIEIPYRELNLRANRLANALKVQGEHGPLSV